ncbi:hypothetical protein [Thermococcus alcaliphilus]|uniref:hypothetical protein n=1 Tax=Thermococcus alcaliphilus TaxID=139207 RepID=UPI0020917E4D|nr:hypothetical protein [Thermococcus alcaliphilus]
MRIFKIKVKLEREDSEMEGVRYVSLLVLANNEEEAKTLVEEYFSEEGVKKRKSQNFKNRGNEI